MLIVNKISINFGTISFLDSKISTFSITNIEETSVEVTDIILGNADFSVSDTSFVLNSGETKTITVTFSPSSISSYLTYLTIKNDLEDVVLELSGICVSAGIFVDRSSIDFGFVTVRTSKTENILVSNISTEDVVLLLVSVTTDNNVFSETLNNFKIEKGEALKIPVTFLPVSQISSTGKLIIHSNDNSLPILEVNLSGVGFLSPNMFSSTSYINFGNVQIGNLLTKTFKITNSGDINLTLSNIFTNNTLFSVTPKNAIILPGQFLLINVSFLPLGIVQQISKLLISSNDPEKPIFEISLEGKGLSPNIDLGQTSLEFNNSNINEIKQMGFNIGNNSDIDLIIQDIQVEGSSDFHINESLPFTIDSSKTVIVDFIPTSLGKKNAMLSIMSNDIEKHIVYVNVSGTGVNPNISIFPNTLDFFDVSVGQTMSLTVTILNSGQGQLVISNISSSNIFFSCNLNNLIINPGKSQNILIEFSPLIGGVQSTGVITFSNNDPDTPDIDLLVSGYGALPIINITESIIDFGSVVANNMKSKDVVINNTGRANLNLVISSNSSFFTTSITNLTVEKNSSQTFSIMFSPEFSINYSGEILLTSNDPNNPVKTLSVLGVGVVSPKINVNTKVLRFNDVEIGNTQVLDLIVYNQGSMMLNFTTSLKNPVNFSGHATFSSEPNSGSIPISSQSILSITFKPNDPSDLEGTLKIQSNDVSEPILNISLQGTGKQAILSWDKINTMSWVPNEIFTIATSMTGIIDPLISALDFTKQILDIIKIFIIDISDVMTILLEQIKKTIDDFINDLSATGLYVLYVLPGKPGITPYTYPQYFMSLPKSSFNIFDINNPSWFDSVKGGYSSFISKIVESFDDPADGRRPQFSDTSMVGAYVMMFDSGTIGPDDIAKFIRSIQKLMKIFRSPFKVAFEPPSNVSAFASNKLVRVTFTPSCSVLPKDYFIFRSKVQGGDVVSYEYNKKNFPCHDENGNPVKSYELIGVVNVRKQLADILGIDENNADSILGEAGYAAKELSSVFLNGDPFRFVYEDTDVVNDRSYYYVVAAGYTSLPSYKDYGQIKNVLSSDFDKKLVSAVDPDTLELIEIEINSKSVSETKILAIGSLSSEISAKPINASFEVLGGLARCRNFRCGFEEEAKDTYIIPSDVPDFFIISNTPVAGSVKIKVSRNGANFTASSYSYRVDYTPKIKENIKSYQATTSKIFIKSKYYFRSNDVLSITYKFKKDLKTTNKTEKVVLDQRQTFLTSKRPIDSSTIKITYNSVALPDSEVTVLNDKDGRVKVNRLPGTSLVVNYNFYSDFYQNDFLKCVKPEYSRYFFDVAKCDAGSTLCTGYDNANCYYNNGSECTNTEKSTRKVLTSQGFISEDISFKSFWDPISCQNGIMQQRCDGYSKTFPRYSPKVWPDWSSVRLSAIGLFPKIEEVMKIMQNLLDSLLAGIEKMSTAIVNFIDLLQKKIDSLRKLLESIRSFLVTIKEDFTIPDLYFLRVPYASGGNEYLKTSISNAENGPESDYNAYTAGVVLVYGTPGLGNALKLFFG
jgi:hypothetical protein